MPGEDVVGVGVFGNNPLTGQESASLVAPSAQGAAAAAPGPGHGQCRCGDSWTQCRSQVKSRL